MNPNNSSTKGKVDTQNRIYNVSKDLIDMMSCEDIKRKYSAEWNCTPANVLWYIKKAYQLIEKSVEKNVDKYMARQTATLEKIANSAMTNNDRANAIKAIDLMNKLANLYTEKAEVTVNVSEPIVVAFGSLTPASNDDDDDFE